MPYAHTPRHTTQHHTTPHHTTQHNTPHAQIHPYNRVCVWLVGSSAVCRVKVNNIRASPNPQYKQPPRKGRGKAKSKKR